MQVQTLRGFFLGICVGGAGFLAFTSQFLPEMVASHFGAGGRVNAYMTRSAYLWMMTILIVGVPSIMLLAFSWLPRRVPQQNTW